MLSFLNICQTFVWSMFDAVGNELIFAPELDIATIQRDLPVIKEWAVDDVE